MSNIKVVRNAIGLPQSLMNSLLRNDQGNNNFNETAQTNAPHAMANIRINIARQKLYFSDNEKERIYSVSTALNGLGQQRDSDQTPLGTHIVRAKIGEGKPINSVFVSRRPTGEIYSPELGKQYPGRDWILTRILWLSGKQVGYNRLGDVDTMRRYIYIHGTPYENELGQAISHGCVRMANNDVIELFDLTPIGCPVEITDE